MAKVNNAIGIEYNSHKLRAVELTKGVDGDYSVTSFNEKDIPSGVFSGGLITDPVMFSHTLAEFLSESKIKTTNPAVIGVNNENVIMRYATFPKVPDDKLRGVIMVQAQDFIPVPLNELNLDFVVIDEAKDDDDQPVVNVLLVGARNTMLDNVISNFEQSKLEVVDVDSSVLAWCRAAIEKAGEEEVLGFFKLTDDILNFVAIENKEIKMVRSINIPDRASVEVKKVFEESDTVIEPEIDTVVEFLSGELSSSVSYYQMQNNSLVNSILFSADTPLQSKLLEKLSERAFIPVSIPNFYGEYMTSDFNPAEYAGCISLAKVALEG